MHSLRLDPFTLMDKKPEELAVMIETISREADAKILEDQIQLAEKAVLYSDIQTIVGELVARYELDYENLKSEVKGRRAVLNKEFRTEWEDEHKGQKTAPASNYFEGLALEETLEQTKTLNAAKADLTRFKKFYDNYETKINALKKLQERVSKFTGF